MQGLPIKMEYFTIQRKRLRNWIWDLGFEIWDLRFGIWDLDFLIL